MKTLFVFCSLFLVVFSVRCEIVVDDLAIVPSENNLNIGKITGSELFLNEGNTYIYTVDTDIDKGITESKISSVASLLSQIKSKYNTVQSYVVKSADNVVKTETVAVVEGDKLIVMVGGKEKTYTIRIQRGATAGKLELVTIARTVNMGMVATGNVEVTGGKATITANTPTNLRLNFYAGMRGPAVTVRITVPQGINATTNSTTVNVIGRGTVLLSELATQSVGRFGDGYRFPKIGQAEIQKNADGSQTVVLSGLDLRAQNKQDVEITFLNASLPQAGEYDFSASYSLTLAEPEILNSGACYTTLKVVDVLTSFARVIDRSLIYKETEDTYSRPQFNWQTPQGASSVKIKMSKNKGATWEDINCLFIEFNKVQTPALTSGKEHWFKLVVVGGPNAGESNIAKFYSGKLDAESYGITTGTDQTIKIDEAIRYLNSLGGGTLSFETGTFQMSTIHLLSNVYLYVNKDATLSALKNGDAPETTYFSDKEYRSGTSATSTGPYKTPENYLSKQDVGHTFFRNCMIFAEREDNIKIIGNGTITGAGNLVTSDGVMNNSTNNRQDKMIVAKLCTNIEVGGLYNPNDLWYTETSAPNADKPYYIDPVTKEKLNGGDTGNMLTILRGGHFVLLATGTDGINTHDVFAGNAGGNVRDIFDYMACNNVFAINIYAQGASDDIVKLGSDCSLGFTRPSSNFKVRNIIGDTNCNLFQIGSETADDIQYICVDNIYVLAGNKAGFSISTNDGAYIKNIYLNCGGTNPDHLYNNDYQCNGEPDKSQYAMVSQMRRTRAPFFISISNRGRTMGGKAKSFTFKNENGSSRTELLSTNINIGKVENIFINNVNIAEIYGGSKYNSTRWTDYDGSQNKATSIIAGYKTGTDMDGKSLVNLPDGRSSADIVNVKFSNINMLLKGGNPLSDSNIIPPELGVGKYNVSDFGVQPSYGFWFRHVEKLIMENCSMQFETNDDRFAMVLDEVKQALLNTIKMEKPSGNTGLIQLKKATDISFANTVFYTSRFGGEWYVKEGEPIEIPAVSHTTTILESYPIQAVEFKPGGKIEGETGAYTMYGEGMSTKTNSEPVASNGMNREFNGGTIGNYVDYIIPDILADTYTLNYFYKKNTPGRAIIQLSVNGVNTGNTIDEYGTIGYYAKTIPNIVVSQSGDVIIRTTIVNKNISSSNYTFIVDAIELLKEDGFSNTENIVKTNNRIYPNPIPVNGIVSLPAIPGKKIHWEIIDMTSGRQIPVKYANRNKNSLIAPPQPGIYIVRIIRQSGKGNIYKLIVK
ncbi:MAG: T9SS type A sorting domain-containing protein [Dysgonamonadaceae bacterium]|nr:T9SS type A sorting domain-containing protein [Dysgonamonadaceae bacterium]